MSSGVACFQKETFFVSKRRYIYKKLGWSAVSFCDFATFVAMLFDRKSWLKLPDKATYHEYDPHSALREHTEGRSVSPGNSPFPLVFRLTYLRFRL
jgi:hypothetical protein